MTVSSIISGRRPRITFQVALAQGKRSPQKNRPILVVGGKSSAGTGVANTPARVASGDEAATHFGRGTLGHLTCKQIFTMDPEATVDACVAGDSTATAAVLDVLIGGGPATVAQTARFCIGGQWAEVPITVGMTDDQFGAAIVTAFGTGGDYPDMPVVATYVSGTNTLTFTSKDKGTNAAAIKWDALDVLGSGLTLGSYSGTLNTSGGANELDWSAAYEAAFAADRYHFVVPTTNTRAAVTAATTGLKARILGLATPSVMKPTNAYLGANGSISDASGSGGTYSGSLDFDGGTVDPDTETGWWFNIPWMKSSPDPACLIAATVAAARAGKTVNNRNARWCNPSTGLVLPGLNPPHAESNYPTDAEIETALNSGVTPIRVDRATGNCVLVWPITCKHVTGGAADFRASDTNIPDVAVAVAELVTTRLADMAWEKLVADGTDGFPPDNLPDGAVTPSIAREYVKAIYHGREVYGRGWVDITYENDAGEIVSVDGLFEAQINDDDPGVLDIEGPCFVSRWLRSIGYKELEYGRG